MTTPLKTMNPLKRFKKGSIIVHILYHAEKEEFYGSWLKKELSTHGYEISYGTLYPWLNRLELSGYLISTERTVKGKNRKYYSTTEKGKQTLEAMKEYLKELYNEVME